MEISKFVETSISEIIKGIVEANKNISNKGAIINPPVKTSWDEMKEAGRPISNSGLPVYEIEYDLSVAITEAKKAKTGLGVQINIISLGASGSKKISDEKISRMKFTIPITFPEGK